MPLCLYLWYYLALPLSSLVLCLMMTVPFSMRKSYYPGVPPVTQWVKDPALTQLWHRSQLQLRCNHWPTVIHRGCSQKKKKKKWHYPLNKITFLIICSFKGHLSRPLNLVSKKVFYGQICWEFFSNFFPSGV